MTLEMTIGLLAAVLAAIAAAFGLGHSRGTSKAHAKTVQQRTEEKAAATEAIAERRVETTKGARDVQQIVNHMQVKTELLLLFLTVVALLSKNRRLTLK